jgi:hypothetical protein
MSRRQRGVRSGPPAKGAESRTARRGTRNDPISSDDACEFMALARWLRRCDADQDLQTRFAELLRQFTPLDEVYALARELKRRTRIYIRGPGDAETGFRTDPSGRLHRGTRTGRSATHDQVAPMSSRVDAWEVETSAWAPAPRLGDRSNCEVATNVVTPRVA